MSAARPPDPRSELVSLLDALDAVAPLAPGDKPREARTVAPGTATSSSATSSSKASRGGRAVTLSDLQQAVEAAAAQGRGLGRHLERRVALARDRLLLARSDVVAGGAADRWLADLATSVQAEIGARGTARWQRAALSESFLEAPRSLVLWRRTAMMACVVAAVGLGLSLTRPWTASPLPSGGRVDPRAELLRRLDDSAAPASFAAFGTQVLPAAGGQGAGARPMGWGRVPTSGQAAGRTGALRLVPLRPGGQVDLARLLDQILGPRPAAAPAEAWSERN